MALLSSFNEDRPVTYFRGYPIYYATILTIAYALGVLATFIAKAAGALGSMLIWFAFDPAQSILGGRLWQIFTYSFIDAPSFFTVIGLLFLYVSAVEVERYIGKARFLTLYGIMVLIPVITLSMLAFGTGYWTIFYGQTEISIGFFIAFCTLYPGIQWGGFFTAKWVAIVSLGVASLVDLSSGAWVPLSELWLTSAFSFGFIRFLQRGGELPSFRFSNPLRRRPKLRVVPRPRTRSRVVETQENSAIEIDPLLDKISKKGLGSLTPEERKALERAREKLIEKDKKR
jgi:hypothetical protein